MIIYCDGSCRGNGKSNSNGGYGVVVLSDEQILLDCYQHQENNTTNNRQELKAILYCMLKYGKNNPIVYSDSAYCVNTYNTWMFGWANAGWVKSDGQTPENLDLINAYYTLYQQGHRINLIKVKGHNGIQGNELADKLATGVISSDEIMKKFGGVKI